jgi:hypothetical protein
VPDVDAAVQEQLDELRDAIHGLRKMLVANGTSEPATPVAAASLMGNAAILDALHETNEQLRRIRCDGVISDADAQRIVEAIDDYFVPVDEEPEQSAKSKGRSKSKATKAEEELDEEAAPRRRGYFPDSEG